MLGGFGRDHRSNPVNSHPASIASSLTGKNDDGKFIVVKTAIRFGN